ncbi:Zmynd10 [Symbiodinium natans]|uniref:Zmynd10 protein n=1 Tax=Symbiodinium natans TaxID=878477 RepID=A0A812U8E2_9DINO|nr:Zmynd10 [Symbiodinium natans]
MPQICMNCHGIDIRWSLPWRQRQLSSHRLQSQQMQRQRHHRELLVTLVLFRSSHGLPSVNVCRSQASTGDMFTYSVPMKILQAFLEATPDAALQSKLCVHRFTHKMSNTYGKKAVEAAIPDGEWMRSESSSRIPARPEADDSEADNLRRGEELVSNASKRLSGDAVPSNIPSRLSDAQQAAEMIGNLRTSIERRVILKAGETLEEKELRELAMDLVTDAVTAAGLDQVIGIQLWARDTATDFVKAAARKLEVKVREA